MKMKRESGDRAYPIWLLVNPKYPAVRHNVWSPVLDAIQDRVYREISTRIDTTNIFIRNAVRDYRIVPNTLNWWEKEIAEEIELFREIVLEYKPRIIVTFGAFPFEFLRRVCQIEPEKGPRFWSTANLEIEFSKAIENFDINKTNRIPLLRRVLASDNFMEAHNCYSQKDGENYYYDVGTRIAEKIIENKDSLNIWIK
ncbi:conserved hypothetical protein [Candidatus Desulfosporosinus infrequens]|uniref:Uncharacterized protein n=1 Tax=Candidatus Desulfosporosinus infrequens TaxID=2043169 RepID=A0A2U3LWI8_9FIRM|nr:conserved hypothetical protein [Candidatus Desulfosporosinus infrequens]